MTGLIRFEINDQVVPLNDLGGSLQNDATLKALARLADRLEQRVSYMRCAEHHMLPVITVVLSTGQSGFRISGCCQHIIDETGEDVQALLKQLARPTFGLQLVVRVNDNPRPYVFDAEMIDELVIGRFDPDTGASPDIDLHEYQAYENGVSRRHAAIVWRNGALNLVDKGTPNGTYLNERRLVPDQPHILRDTDHIRVGRLTLHIEMQYPVANNALLS
jgi:hypothetical protein